MRRIAVLCALMTALGFSSGASASERTWQMGYGDAEIRADLDDGQAYYIAGYRNGYTASGVLDWQKAKAIYVSDGRAKMLLVVVDCVGLASGDVAVIREKLNALVPAGTSVHIESTHTHAGIDTLGLWGPIGRKGKNDGFMRAVYGACVSAAQAALGDVREGRLYTGQAETSGMQRDSRDPQIYDRRLTQIRFAPSDGAPGIRLVNFAAHAEALRSENTLVSADYPAYLSKAIYEATGDRTVFTPGAVGGLIMTPLFCDDVVQNVQKTGAMLAEYALGIKNETEIPPDMYVDTEIIAVPCDNTVFLTLKTLGVVSHLVVGSEDGRVMMETRLTYLRLGDTQILLVPGELFPELALGQKDNAGNPTPLNDIFGADLVVFGLSDDEVGYIVPPAAFSLLEEAPYLRYVKGHYEESNSLGPETAARLVEAAKTLRERWENARSEDSI